MLGRCLQEGPRGQGAVMCTYLSSNSPRKSKQAWTWRNETGSHKTGHCCCFLSWHWEQLITERQLFSQSSASGKQSWRSCSQQELNGSSRCLAQRTELSALGNVTGYFWDFFQHGSPLRELHHHIVLTDWGKTAGYAFLEINLRQISFHYWLNLQSCLFLISFPGVRNPSVKSIQYDSTLCHTT